MPRHRLAAVPRVQRRPWPREQVADPRVVAGPNQPVRLQTVPGMGTPHIQALLASKPGLAVQRSRVPGLISTQDKKPLVLNTSELTFSGRPTAPTSRGSTSKGVLPLPLPLPLPSPRNGNLPLPRGGNHTPQGAPSTKGNHTPPRGVFH